MSLLCLPSLSDGSPYRVVPAAPAPLGVECTQGAHRYRVGSSCRSYNRACGSHPKAADEGFGLLSFNVAPSCCISLPGLRQSPYRSRATTRRFPSFGRRNDVGFPELKTTSHVGGKQEAARKACLLGLRLVVGLPLLYLMHSETLVRLPVPLNSLRSPSETSSRQLHLPQNHPQACSSSSGVVMDSGKGPGGPREFVGTHTPMSSTFLSQPVLIPQCRHGPTNWRRNTFPNFQQSYASRSGLTTCRARALCPSASGTTPSHPHPRRLRRLQRTVIRAAHRRPRRRHRPTKH